MRGLLVLLSCLQTSFSALPEQSELSCTLCLDILTDLDNFITEDTTEEEIVERFEIICLYLFFLGSNMVEDCEAMMEKLPEIIESIVDKHPPQDICEALGACP